MHEYSIELRIEGAGLDIAQVSQWLGLEPTLILERDETTIWAYDGGESFDDPRYWSSFEEGMNSVLVKLLPIKQKIEALKSKFEVYFWCGHLYDSFDGGPHFSAKLLADLGELGVPIYLETHCFRRHVDTREVFSSEMNEKSQNNRREADFSLTRGSFRFFRSFRWPSIFRHQRMTHERVCHRSVSRGAVISVRIAATKKTTNLVSSSARR